PFRDIFVEHGLGEDVIKPMLACKLLGDSVESLRRVGQNAYVYRGILPPLGVVALVLAAAMLIRRTGLVVLIGIAASTTLCEATDRHMFGFLAVACAGMFLSGRDDRWLIIAGCSAVVATLYSLEVGLYVMAAIGAALVVYTWPAHRSANAARSPSICRPLVLFAGGVAVAAMPFLLWCVSRGLTRDFFHNMAMQLFQRREVFGLAYPRPGWISQAPAWANIYDAAQIVMLFYGI